MNVFYNLIFFPVTLLQNQNRFDNHSSRRSYHVLNNVVFDNLKTIVFIFTYYKSFS